jgi:glycosyltransferase involved in cell wall biosynthesis
LVYVCREKLDILEIQTEWHPFDEKTFFKILASCDIGVYAFKNDDEGKGKMAMKVLDYMSAGLASVTTPVGLSPYAVHDENLLMAETPAEWGTMLEKLITDKFLRERLGKNARKTIEERHALALSYEVLKKIIFDDSAKLHP